jgi:hypothetical protein
LLNRVSVKGIVVANVTTASKTNPATPNSICHATTKPNTQACFSVLSFIACFCIILAITDDGRRESNHHHGVQPVHQRVLHYANLHQVQYNMDKLI